MIVRHHSLDNRQVVCTEQVTLEAGGAAVEHLPFAVRALLIGDLPTNLWWAAPIPPPVVTGIAMPDPVKSVAGYRGEVTRRRQGDVQGLRITIANLGEIGVGIMGSI